MTEPRYILLAEGEKIQRGDEFLNKDGRWELYANSLTGLIPSNGYAVRRKLEGWREIKDGGEITFPCAVVFASGQQFTRSICEDRDDFNRLYRLYTFWHLGCWLPLPPLPVKQSDAEIAWAEYCEKQGKQANDHTFTLVGFLAGFEAGRKK